MTYYYSNESRVVENPTAAKMLAEFEVTTNRHARDFDRLHCQQGNKRPLFNLPKLYGTANRTDCWTDKNIPCDGTRFHFNMAYELFTLVPLFAVEAYQYGHDCLNFVLNFSIDFTVRSTDDKVTGAGFGTVTVYGESDERKKNNNRIWYHTQPYIPKQLDGLVFARTYAEIQRINEVFKFYRWQLENIPKVKGDDE